MDISPIDQVSRSKIYQILKNIQKLKENKKEMWLTKTVQYPSLLS